ncbi:hypothetical Protein YC6258_04636 [Gynuella sunshinyii YC6258]|uniref:Uncharacterized protein n=1 Tax=Gynuella sunshinyii YC6258 TaxID=1445510 RepID=A0A0C5VTP0_9GAMM|nr:hypothetical Protein YC6258_04636 [Gynuella sunshinyii YC6258]
MGVHLLPMALTTQTLEPEHGEHYLFLSSHKTQGNINLHIMTVV